MRIPLAGASLPGTSRRFSPAPHPARACGRGYPDTSPASPAPPGGGSARAYIRGAAVSGVQPVGSRALDRGDIATGGGGSRGGGTRSPSPVSNAPTILLLAGLPHPTRAFGAPPPPPPGGGGSACDIRGTAVSGSSPGSPHAVDRGDIATGGEADGEGELVPPPLSLTLQPSYFSPATPTPPAPAALLPRPLPAGGGSAWRYQGNSRTRGEAGEQPYPGWSQWEAVSGVEPGNNRIRGGYRHGGRGLARRGLPPSCHSRFKHLTSPAPLRAGG